MTRIELTTRSQNKTSEANIKPYNAEYQCTKMDYVTNEKNEDIIRYSGWCIAGFAKGFFDATANMVTGVHELTVTNITHKRTDIGFSFDLFIHGVIKQLVINKNQFKTKGDEIFTCELTDKNKLRFKTIIPAYSRDQYFSSMKSVDLLVKSNEQFYSDGDYFRRDSDDSIVATDVESIITESMVFDTVGNLIEKVEKNPVVIVEFV